VVDHHITVETQACDMAVDFQAQWEDIQMMFLTVDYKGQWFWCIKHSGVCEWPGYQASNGWLWIDKRTGRIKK